MNKKRQISAAIFDMDGLILNTEHAYSEGTQTVLARYGQIYTTDMKTQLMGKRAIEAASRLLEMVDLPMGPEEFLSERDAQLRQLFPQCTPLPGAAELIRSLSAANVPIAVGTSSGQDLFEVKTAPHRQLFDLFNATVTVDDPAVKNGKPAPDIFLVAAQALGVKPDDCIVFEDSATGVAAGKAAGMSVIAIPDEMMDKALYLDADEVLNSLADFEPTRYGLSV